MTDINSGYRRIIPTPQSIVSVNKPARIYSRNRTYSVCLQGSAGDKIRFAGDFLCREVLREFGLHLVVGGQLDEDTVIICSDYTLLNEYLDADSLKVFDNDPGRQQGYVIKSSPGEPVILCAASEQGCLYAVSTLLQILRVKDDQIILGSQVIADYPDFKYRGNCWLIMAECGIWSYDRGDGVDGYRKRANEKLDMCVRYKVNTILFDGLGWATDKFPGYADLMQEINKEARLRGIHLMYVGYGSGYGAAGRGLYKGKVFQNRRSYPDGEEYPCLGGVGMTDDAKLLGRFSGTCLTNIELMRLKCGELKQFVEEVQPGAMYIHNLDNDRVSKDMWLLRCPDCRKRWPSDELDTADGMAGAYADFYDQLAECIKSVKRPGYDADRDCVLYMVSPGYTMPNHSDEDWQTALSYWPAVSRFMKHKHNVSFMFREQFYNHDTNTLRCAQMRDALDSEGQGHEFGIIYFYGADGFHNDQLLLPTPSSYYIFKGADAVIAASGHAYQEPMQLLNAEYLWNSENSAFYNLENRPTNYTDFFQLYLDMMEAGIRPEELYGNEGFLGVACKKLYGEIAGPVMAEVFALHGEHNEPLVPFISNKDLGAGGFNPFAQLAYGVELSLQDVLKTKTKLCEIYNITTHAQNLVTDLLVKFNVNDSVWTEIEWYKESLEIGARYTKHLRDYVAIYEQLLNHFELAANIDDVNQKIKDLSMEINDTKHIIKSSGLEAIDYLGGALAGRESTLVFLESNLEEMSESIIQDKRFVKPHQEVTPWW